MLAPLNLARTAKRVRWQMAPENLMGAGLGYSGCYTGSGNIGPSFGGTDLLANGAMQELKRNVASDPIDPNSAALIALLPAYFGIDFGNTSGGLFNNLPYNIVPGTQPLLPVSTVAPNPMFTTAPIPSNPSIEGHNQSLGIPTTNVSGDHHLLIAVRNETTLGIDYLYELYKVWSTDGGLTWNCHSGAYYDLTTGDLLPDPVLINVDAAGLPVLPLLCRYEEVSTGTINHALRCVITTAASSRTAVWPARSSAGNLGYAYTDLVNRIPAGARIRLNAAWYSTNRSSFSGNALVILDCLYNYGLILADYSNAFHVEGSEDDRWDGTITSLNAIPSSAFEIVQLQPQYTVSINHSNPPIGGNITATIAKQALNSGGGSYTDAGYHNGLYIYDYVGGYGVGSHTNPGIVTLIPGTTSGTVTWTPTTAGLHGVVVADASTEDLPPPQLFFTLGTPFLNVADSLSVYRPKQRPPLSGPQITRLYG